MEIQMVNPNLLREEERLRQAAPPLTFREYDELKNDIAERGVQVPVEVTPGFIILCGHHRVKAARELGLKEVPARIVDLAEPVEQEIHARKDNVLRRQYSSEAAALQRAAIAELKLSTTFKGRQFKENPRSEQGFTVCQNIGQTVRQKDVWAETARDLGVSKQTLHNDIQYKKAVEEYPDLATVPKTTAIKAAKTFQSMPPAEVEKKLTAIREVNEQGKKGIALIDEAYRIKALYRDAVNKIASLSLEHEHIKWWLHEETRDRLETYLSTIERDLVSLEKLKKHVKEALGGPRLVKGGN